MPKFRKKPIVIEAHEFRPAENKIPAGIYSSENADPRTSYSAEWMIRTLEGPLRVSDGDWIITGVQGERYPIKPDIFAATYEPAE
jgi:hypothetical protein